MEAPAPGRGGMWSDGAGMNRSTPHNRFRVRRKRRSGRIKEVRTQPGLVQTTAPLRRDILLGLQVPVVRSPRRNGAGFSRGQ
jgi:hypothetical protein